ncbi:hypothetical protein SSS_04414 [Sarcoptes scabiei]|uniref:Uncharacterized protein n=1 Tax=Sarcoptes scabiei TaxID=52283 RepID=A0A834R7A2_SARSC|nr:hypothetical protein SSS_04414 [Sarcoptes scabiei]UXI14962.1 Solute carrier family 25 member 38 [Sarcoptes scabiei]
MSRILKTLYHIRDRITFWAIKTTNETYDDDEENGDDDDEQNEAIDLSEIDFEGRGMRTEKILRAIIRVPIRFFHLTYHARKLERSLNKEHPECPVRIKVVDSLVGNDFIENLFDTGLIIIPCLFLLSFFIWALGQFVARSILEPISLATVMISVVLFVVFGIVFVFAAFFGYEFEYVDGKKHPRRKRNPPESYQKMA